MWTAQAEKEGDPLTAEVERTIEIVKSITKITGNINLRRREFT